MKKILITYCFLLAIMDYAQLKMQQVQIKSPETYAFEKYGSVPVNLYTGMIDMRLPLYNLNVDGENSINVLLSYDSSGFIPHKKSDLGGMGWSLIAGGRISRTVNRMPDEYMGNPTSSGGNQFDSGADLNGFLTGVRLNPYTNVQVYDLNSGAGGTNGGDWRLGSVANGYEGEPDSFNFSVLGLSGKFMIGNDGKVIVESNDPNIKVDISGLKTYGLENNCKLTASEIIMKDGKGNTYYFGGDFSKYEVSYTVPGYNGTGNIGTKTYYTINAWSISKINFADGKEVTFNYVTDSLHQNFCQKDTALTQEDNAKILSLDAFFQDGARSGYLENCPGGLAGCMTSSQSGQESSETFILLKKSLLESINYNDTSIFINYKDTGYAIAHHYLATNFFNEFVIDYISLKQSSTTIKNYQFNYVDLGGINKRPFLYNIIETKSNSKYAFEYYNTGNLPKYYTKGIDHWGFWNGKDSNTDLVDPGTYNQSTGDYTLSGTVRGPNTSLYNVGLLSKIIYPTSGYTTFEYEPQNYGKRIERNSGSAFLPTLTDNYGNIGGARIKRQFDYSEYGGLVNEKEYQYSTVLNGISSSGILMNWPRYLYFIEWQGQGYYENLFLKSSSNVQQNSLDSYNIGYSKVYEINKNKGYTEHNFYSYQDYPDIFTSGEPKIKKYLTETYQSFPENLYKNFRNLYAVDKSIMRGRPKSEIMYPQNATTPIKMTEYVYNDNINYNPNTIQDDNNYVSINHLSGHWVQAYKKYFNSSSLKKITTTDYFNGSSVTTFKEFLYNSSRNLNLTEEKMTAADGDIHSTQYQYTTDLLVGSPNQPQSFPPPYKFIVNLFGKNMFGLPLVKSNYKNTTFINRTQTLYGFNSDFTKPTLPIKELSYSEDKTAILGGSYTIPITSYATTELSYDEYDDKGNLLQYTTKSGISTSIIWGYHHTKPIAKIVGATYAQLTSLPGIGIFGILSASDQDEQDPTREHLLIDALDNFRSNPNLSNYQITTYTYDPLIGVTSITPPSGLREVYTYDNANRLEFIKDVYGNILKDYQYHYKP